MINLNFPKGTRFEDAHLSKIELPSEHMPSLGAWVKDPKGMLLFLGNPGIGKTYFCAALRNHFKYTVYSTENDFLKFIRSSISEPGADYTEKVQIMASYHAIWILDDLGTSQMTEWQKEVIHLFVDERYKAKLPLVITSNIWLRDMKSVFSDRFRSRLNSGENTIIECIGEDRRPSEGRPV